MLRRAIEIDFNNVHALIKKYPAQLSPVSRENLRGYFDKGYVYWQEGVAVIARPLSGTSYLGFPVPRKTTHLIVIASSRAAKGAASRAMEGLIAASPGGVVLSVLPYNIRAKRFYLKFGFSKIGEYRYPTFAVDIFLRKGHT